MSCVVLCYAVGVLCYEVLVALYATMYYTLGTVSITHVLLLRTAGYIEELLHHLCHVACIHRGVEDTTHWTMAKEM